VIEPNDRSYRALFSIPDLGRVIVSMQLARIASSMVGVALVLFTLAEYDSPELAGLVTFATLMPGLLISPIAGAMLDRHGRVRLIRLDYAISVVVMLTIGILSLLDLLSPALLLLIAVISSLTSPFSQTGLRSLFPLMVPEPLWERINAFDSNGYVVASIFGPPLAAALVAFVGPQAAVMAVAVPFALAGLALLGVKEPPSSIVSTGKLLRDAFDGLRYVWRNPTLRGLGFSISALNVGNGIVTIVLPVLIVRELGGSEFLVGVAFAVSGISGIASTFAFGRLDSRGREWAWLVYPMALAAPITALLLLANAAPVLATPVVGLLVAGVSMLLIGFLWGPLDIAMFTMRQRRTDPSWIGRAFAVSMAFNFAGYPIGAALAGVLAERSLDVAIVAAVVAGVVATVFAALMVPRHQTTAWAEPRTGESASADAEVGPIGG
jgi:MFS family permease